MNMAEKSGLYLILDNHSSDGSNGETPDTIADFLVPLWTQLASHFKDRPAWLLYEIMNEPYNINPSVWGKAQQKAIDAIRSVDKAHTIVVGGSSWNSIDMLSYLPEYSDKNLLYTFHDYDPFDFTHMGATWSSDYLADLRGVRFPIKAGTIRDMAFALNNAVSFSRKRGVPVFCGEFGAYNMYVNELDRERYYKVASELFDQRKIPRVSWDYFDSFGLFKKNSRARFPSDLERGVVAALGLTVPSAETESVVREGFVIYDDLVQNKIDVSKWGAQVLDLYNAENPKDGNYAIKWSDANAYESVTFRFTQKIDWPYLAENYYCVVFDAKADREVSFDVRFLDNQEGGELPWRVRSTITGDQLPADGIWHTVSIPLSSMNEQGAWTADGPTWHNPQGLFDWSRVASFEITAEHGALTDKSVYLDNVRIEKR
jgi:endoglucanase